MNKIARLWFEWKSTFLISSLFLRKNILLTERWIGDGLFAIDAGFSKKNKATAYLCVGSLRLYVQSGKI